MGFISGMVVGGFLVWIGYISSIIFDEKRKGE